MITMTMAMIMSVDMSRLPETTCASARADVRFTHNTIAVSNKTLRSDGEHRERTEVYNSQLWA